MTSKAKTRLHKLLHDTDGGRPSQRAHAVDDEASDMSLSTFSDAATSTTDDVSGGVNDTPAALVLDMHRHVAGLEAKVMDLLHERKQLLLHHEQELRAKDAELAQLQQCIENDVSSLRLRQEEVEARAPLMEVQLQEARAALCDVTISKEVYAHLKQAPSDRLGLADAARVTVYEATQQLASDNERLRLAAASAQATAQRLAEENTRLQREAAHLAAAAADTGSEEGATVGALEARVQWLTGQLEEAGVQLEVLAAKGQMYDELQAKNQQLEEEVARLAGAEAAARSLHSRVHDAEARTRDHEHTVQLLLTDKAYLEREVGMVSERLSRADAELDSLRSEVAELKTSRQELYRKLYEAETAVRSETDGRLASEVRRVQEMAAADLERIRREAAEASEREVRLLRDLRDQAQEEAATLRAELRQLRGEHDGLLALRREAAGHAEARIAELQGDLKVKALEVQQLQALADERAGAMSEMRLQVELMTDKVRLLTDALHASEAQSAQQLDDVSHQLALAQLPTAEPPTVTSDGQALTGMEAGRTGAASARELAGQGAAPRPLSPAVQRSVRHHLQLASRCARLEADKAQLTASVDQLRRQLDEARAELSALRHHLQLAGQPHSYLLTQLSSAEARARSAEVQATALKSTARQTATEKEALKQDLERILRERGTLESLRHLVLTAMASSGAAARAQPLARSADHGNGLIRAVHGV